MDQPRPPLLPDERVLWEGAPPRGLLFYAHDAWLIPASLLVFGFSVVWEAGVWRQGGGFGGWFMRAWGMPFVSYGAYLIMGRFPADAWARRRLHYLVTDRRIMIRRSGWRGYLRSLDIGWLPIVALTPRRGGSGDLRFGLQRLRRTRGGRMVERDLAAPALSPVPQFIAIPNAAGVQALIERAARAREAEVARAD